MNDLSPNPCSREDWLVRLRRRSLEQDANESVPQSPDEPDPSPAAEVRPTPPLARPRRLMPFLLGAVAGLFLAGLGAGAYLATRPEPEPDPEPPVVASKPVEKSATKPVVAEYVVCERGTGQFTSL